MSWSIKAIGTREAVKKVVAANSSMPLKIKDVITEILDEEGNGNQYVNPPIPHDFALVEGCGHSGGGYGGITNLKVELLTSHK
jgi:hypothetical protein